MDALFNSRWVEAQVDRTIESWRQSAGKPIPVEATYNAAEQQRREDAYDRELRAVESELNSVPRTRAKRAATQDHVISSFARFSATALDLEPAAISLLTGDFLPMGRHLAHWATRFDPGLSKPDMIQACRNAWTACGLQQLLGAAAEITPSILGYSLLYPYSDNYLDQPRLSTEQKLRFSGRFRSRLAGVPISPASPHEAAVWTMVHLIEEQYPRGRYPEVFDCLLAIHQAQEQSLAQLKSRRPLADRELLRISCAKGGTSVLADACLVRGSLNEQESRFSFEWGVLLQLGDDLQDVREDLQRGSETLFTRAACENKPLDALVLQLLDFTNQVADQIDRAPDGSPTLKKLLRMSWSSLIRMAVADSHEFFTPEFLEELERNSPFRFGFLRARNKRLARRRGLYSKLFDVLVEDCDADAVRPRLPDYRINSATALYPSAPASW